MSICGRGINEYERRKIEIARITIAIENYVSKSSTRRRAAHRPADLVDTLSFLFREETETILLLKIKRQTLRKRDDG